MFRNYSLLAGTMLTFAFTSCSNDEIETIPYEGPVAAQVTAGIDGVATRAADTSWETGDAIGISCSSTGDVTKYINMKYVTANGNGTFTHYNGDNSGIFFQGAEEVTFSAYYPFTGTEKSAPGTNGVISGNTSQQSTNQKNIDYMYAGGVKTTYANPTVSFTDNNIFKHKMTRLKLVLQTSADAGFSADDVENGTYTLGGLKHEGTFNVTDGTAAATSSSTAVSDWSVSTNCPSTDAADGKRTYTMILYPQTVTGALPFTATIANQNYGNSSGITFTDNELLAGTSYTFTITIKKTGLVVSGCSIEGWGTEVTGTGDATMQ